MEQLILKDPYTPSPIMKDVYRRIRTNIMFTGVENKVICVTSCGAGDGKSLVTFALARTFAENGSRVLVIDADLRNTYLYKRFGVGPETLGLSHYLSGLSCLEDTIYETDIKNLFLLPAGAVRGNSTELLGKERMNRLISAVKETYDYVLVDTAPLGLLVDAAIVARVCDGSVMVVDASNNSRRTVSAVQEQLVQANPNFLGVILNKVDDSGHGYGYSYGKRYGYSYGYGYGYGYGQSEKQEDYVKNGREQKKQRNSR